MNLFCGKKRWVIPDFDIEDIKTLCYEMKISEVLAMLLVRRGIKRVQDARWFMNTRDLYLYDPFLLNDMDKAAERIKRAVLEKEKICVYGDYDVDGITATAVVYKYLKSEGADVIYYIPERLSEGYGMNIAAIESLREKGVKLIVTVDNGITATDEIEFAKKIGIDVVVTDHHECRGKLPDCIAVVNPKRPDNKYPFDGLSGVGVAFKLVCALENGSQNESFYKKYVDLVALGTVADVMPLFDENRQIVAKGLECIENGSNLGITALIDEALCEKNKNSEKHINSSTVGFTVAPRLNAAGRMGNVSSAIELLICNDYKECLRIADELCTKNRERQYIENKIFNEAVEKIQSEHDFENDKVIVVSGENWHHGVVGIVASKITEKYNLPSILICVENGVGKGSARSIKGFNINEAIHECASLLVKHGGHELAAGLTINIENLDEFEKCINDIAREKISGDMLAGKVEIDAELTGADVNLELCEELSLLEPYGAGNPTPVLYMRDVEVTDVISLGQNRHTKLLLQKDGAVFEGLYFGFCPDNFIIPKSSALDLLFNLDVNEFRGVKSPQIIIRDVRLSELDAKCCVHQTEIYHEMLRGKHPGLTPGIELCRKVYVYLRNNESLLSEPVNAYVLSDHIAKKTGELLGYAVFRVILDVFSEMGLVCAKFDEDDPVVRIELIKNCEKVSLENSEVLKKVKNIK